MLKRLLGIYFGGRMCFTIISVFLIIISRMIQGRVVKFIKTTTTTGALNSEDSSA